MTEKLHDHCFVVTLDSIPVDLRDALATSEEAIEFVLVLKLGELGANGFQFDCALLRCLNVATFVNLSKGSTSDFFHKLVLPAYSQVHLLSLCWSISLSYRLLCSV